MTIKITKAVRTTIRAILADSSQYDADTMVITRDGAVTALKDADKTFNGPETSRLLVCRVSDMVDEQGNRREGW